MSELRVALLSVELGRMQRGFERYFAGLYRVLKDELNVTLIKGGGASVHGERVPPMFGPAAALSRALPLGSLAGGGEYKLYKRDCLAFAGTVIPHLMRNKFDVVHVIDPPLARILQHVLPRTGSRLLFTEGCLMPLEYYPRADHIHYVSVAPYQAALAAGLPPEKATLAPCGLDTASFAPPDTKANLRRKHGIRESTFVVLVISAVKSVHKRVDYIIEEVTRLQGDVMLWIDGNPEDLAVVELARQKLGERCRITHVKSSEVRELYGCADVLAHAALEESFGLAIVEAMSAGLPALAHDSPHFEWLTGGREWLVDMSRQGALAGRLAQMRERCDYHPGTTQMAASIRERFDWSVVKPQYTAMYRQVACLKSQAVAGK